MTLQDLIDRLSNLPPSARTAVVIVDLHGFRTGEEADDDPFEAAPASVSYEQGEVTISLCDAPQRA